jgi:hypothetical protein
MEHLKVKVLHYITIQPEIITYFTRERAMKYFECLTVSVGKMWAVKDPVQRCVECWTYTAVGCNTVVTCWFSIMMKVIGECKIKH